MKTINEITAEEILEIGKLTLHKNGILIFESKKESFELNDYQQLISDIKKITQNNRVPYLTDERGMERYMDKESKLFISKVLHQHISALAILEDSAIMRFLTHTFIAMYRPKVPVKMFKKKEEAIIWLENYTIS